LTIEDDGIGYDKDNISKDLTSNHFGLVLIDSLVKNELKGQMNTTINSGVKHMITF